MKCRKMGDRIPWKVSALGFGCMRLPKKRFLFWKRPDVDAAVKLIRHGIDQGINYIDTAWGYMSGKSEKIVGKALKDGYREKVHLVTKLPTWKIKSQDDFEKYMHKQLDRLQEDHLDIYLFHALNKERFEKIKELNLIEKMEQAKEDGFIDYIGFSFHDTFQVFREIVDYYDWDSCLVQHNYYDENFQATYEGIKYAADQGMAVAIMEPLRGGSLVDPDPEAKAVMEKAENRRSPVEWALQYLWNKPEISVVLSGMGSTKMVDENCTYADRSGVDILSEEDQKTIQKIAQIYRDKIIVPCTTCGYCLEEDGCPENLNIPENFAALNRYSQTGDKSKFQKQFDKMDKNERSASYCVECGSCLERCPQNINIPEELKKVNGVFKEGKDIGEYRI